MPIPLAGLLGGAATLAFLPGQIKDVWNAFGGDFGGQAARGARAQYEGLAPGRMREEMALEGELAKARGMRADLTAREVGQAMPGPGPEQDLGVQMFLRDAVQPYEERLARIAAVQQSGMDPVSRELARLGVQF